LKVRLGSGQTISIVDARERRMCVPGLYIHSYEKKDIEAWIKLFNRHINEIEFSMVELWAPFAAAHRLVVLVLLFKN